MAVSESTKSLSVLDYVRKELSYERLLHLIESGDEDFYTLLTLVGFCKKNLHICRCLCH